MSERDGHFIFREAEFEVDDFSAASFVARHRRVSSLEALREQLRGYCESLKKELYGIINRDYRDFIAIATKLDGVDLRVDHLRKPLLDLRIDLEVLRDNLVASTSAVHDKLSMRSEISSRKQLIEHSLIAMSELDVIEAIIEQPIGKLEEVNVDIDSNINDSNKKLNRRDLLQKLAKTNGISSVIAIDEKVFYSSELERAAYSLSRALSCLQTIKSSNDNRSNGSVGNNSTNQLIIASSSGLSKTLEQRIQRLRDILIQRLRSQIVSIFSNSASSLTGSIDSDSNMEAEASRIQKLFSNRAFTHCIRALILLSRGDVAEEVVATTVVEPYIKSTITHGRADGSGGRGSYAGLKECLENLVNMLRATLQPALEAAELIGSTFCTDDNETSGTFDLVVNGIWLPVTTLLTERFSSIFNSGIASTFARCYNAVENFTKILASVAGPKYAASITDRLANHPLLKEFHGKWKLELYFHLRSQEIARRLDKACSTVSQQFLTVNTFDIIYGDEANSSSSGSQDNTGVIPVVSTLSLVQIDALKSSLNIASFHLPLITCFAIEVSTCLHNTVLLKALGAKLFSFAMKIVYRLEAQIVFMLDINVDANVSDDQQLKLKTPMKRNPSSIMSPHPPTPANETNSENTTPNCSIEELVLLTADLHGIAEWLEKRFTSYAEEALGFSSTDDNICKCTKILRNRLEMTRDAVWNKVCSLLSTECKKSLVSVKAIAGKYRMTNKPPPDSASPYVENIVLPLRSFLAQHNKLIQPFAPQGEWSANLLEDIASSFLIQVQSLMETVKQMDNALQRRSKIRTAGANTNSMTDSDKIALQVSLDVKAFGYELKSLGVEPDSSKAYCELLEAAKTLESSK